MQPRSPHGAIRAITPVFDGLWRNAGQQPRISLRSIRATDYHALCRFIHWPAAARLLRCLGRISTVALSPASADPARRGARAPWVTRERWTAIRRPLTTLVVVVAGWEILARTVLTNRLFFAPPSDVALAAMRLLETGGLPRPILVSFSEPVLRGLPAIVIGPAVGVVRRILQRVVDS